MQTLNASPLGRTISETPTDIWNDSCAVDELEYAVAFGAVGATANPTIVVDNWRKDPARWSSRVRELAAEQSTWSERELAWGIVAEMSVRAAPLLLPAFEASGGRAGRLSVQTDPTLFRDAPAMVTQAFGFTELAPNIIVKFPTTSAGVAAMEEASYRGISVNATVSFSVAQAIAAAEAVQRGIDRRDAEGLPTDDMGPVITIMMGRTEDWLRRVAEREGLVLDPAALAWSGVAVFKRAYHEWQSRGFRARLLGAAIRNHLHWSELIGADVVITMPSSWQKRFNASSIDVRPRIDNPVPHLDELASSLPDFRRAYEPDGLAVADFDTWGPSVRTLRAFVASYHELLHLVSDAMLPNPDA
ncbi:MAG: transaldolase family protein [Candidatus Limnocylindria bacterium]